MYTYIYIYLYYIYIYIYIYGYIYIACKPIHKRGCAPFIRSITGLDEGDVKSKRPYMRSACCITWDGIVVVQTSQSFSLQCVASETWPRSVDSNNPAMFCLSMSSFVGGRQQGMALKNPAFSNWSQCRRALCRCCTNCRRCGSSTPECIRVNDQKLASSEVHCLVGMCLGRSWVFLERLLIRWDEDFLMLGCSNKMIRRMGWIQLYDPFNHRSLLQKKPMHETIFCKKYLSFEWAFWP